MKKIFRIVFFILISDFVIALLKPCFTQQEFETEYQKALENFRTFESNLSESVDIEGIGIPESSPLAKHFASSHISPEIFAHNEFATVVNIVLKHFRTENDYSSAEFKECLSKISTQFCPKLKENCNSTE